MNKLITLAIVALILTSCVTITMFDKRVSRVREARIAICLVNNISAKLLTAGELDYEMVAQYRDHMYRLREQVNDYEEGGGEELWKEIYESVSILKILTKFESLSQDGPVERSDAQYEQSFKNLNNAIALMEVVR